MIKVQPGILRIDPSRHRTELNGDGRAPDSWGGGGWTYHAHAALLRLRCDAATGIATLRNVHGTIREWRDPLEALAWMPSLCMEKPVDGPAFKGGWIGWIAYDAGRWFEPASLRRGPPDDLGLPLFEFTYHDSTFAIGASESLHIEHSHNFGTEPLPFPDHRAAPRSDAPLRSNFTRAEYEHAVRRAIQYIGAGDVFQVNLSQRFTAGLPASPEEIYNRIIRKSPAAFGAFLGYDDYVLISNSPELFLRVTPDPRTGKRQVITRPIKGTRPRARGMDVALRDSLKDQAELNMIIDLERNDLGRVCEIGSVRVTSPRTIEAHPTVYHGVATIEGTLRDEVTFVDLLRATFPGGSVTGAPKIRAMQIIDALEPHARGPYCGAIGYLSVDGHVEFNVAIRTMTLKDGQAHIPVGGGIVADSQPSAEYEETLVKARAMFEALGMPENPVDRRAT